MASPSLNWDDARIFIEVARCGQILAASRRLALNHATVSRRMSALEAAFGTRLLDRRPNGCELTAEGAALLESAERMEEEMLLLGARIGQSDLGLAGTIRIGAPDGFGTAFLAPRLAELTGRHPDLTIQLVPVPRSFSISRREADIAITVDRPAEGRLVAAKLVDYSLGLYGATAYLDRHGRPSSEEDLTKHRLVGHVDDLLYSPLLDYAEEFSRHWRSHLEISSALGQVEAVAGGAGIGILHDFIASRRPGLEPVLPERCVRRAYWIVYHESARTLRRVSAVASFIRESVEAERAAFLPRG